MRADFRLALMRGLMLVAVFGQGWAGETWAAPADFGPPGQGAAPAPSATPLPAFVPVALRDSVILERSQDPVALAIGQEAVVQLTLRGQSDAACLGFPGAPVDALIVFDISTSAGIGPGSNWEHTAALTQALLDQLDEDIYRTLTAPPEISRIGLVGSQTGTNGPEPLLVQPLTSDFAVLRTQASLLSPSGDTDVAAGLLLAARELAQTDTGRAPAIILMLHDNAPINPNTQAALNTVATQGIPVHVVVNSLNQTPEQQITPALAAQLAPVASIVLDPTPQQLRALFIDLTGGDRTLAARLWLTEDFAPPGAAALLGLLDSIGQIRTDQASWALDVHQGETVTLGYRWRLAQAADLTVQSHMAWLDCNGYRYSSLDGFSGTPMPANTPVHLTAQPATAATAPRTPTAVAVIGDVGAGPVAGAAGGDVWAGLRSAWPWLLLLPLLLLLLCGLWLWRGRRSKTEPKGPGTERPADRGGQPTPQTGTSEPKPSKPEPRPGDNHDLWQPFPDELPLAEDGSGRRLRLWASPAEDQLWAAIKAGQTTTLDFTIKTDTNESVAYFRLTFVPRQVSNPLFERPDRWHQAQLTDFAVAQNSKPALQRQTRQLLVAKIEPLARHFKAREVMSALPDETLRALLSEHGYRERAGPVSALADQYKDLTVGEASRSSAPSAGATTGPSESFKE